jgi:hypothetical protein
MWNTFPNGDVNALTECLDTLLRDPARQEFYREAPIHIW